MLSYFSLRRSSHQSVTGKNPKEHVSPFKALRETLQFTSVCGRKSSEVKGTYWSLVWLSELALKIQIQCILSWISYVSQWSCPQWVNTGVLEHSPNVGLGVIPFTPSRVNGMLKENILEDRLYQSPAPSSGLPDFRIE